MLKKKASAAVCVLAVMALGNLIWLYGCHNQKSNDNLPALSSIAEMEEADANELLAGNHRTQLRTVWEEPAYLQWRLALEELPERLCFTYPDGLALGLFVLGIIVSVIGIFVVKE